MWRSFFFAVGVMLIILGFECLIADRFEISNSARIPEAIVRMFDAENSQQLGMGQFPNANGSRTGFGNSSSGGSLFGPSRFSSPLDSSSARLRQPDKRPFSLAGFGSKRAKNAGQISPKQTLVPGKDTRIVYTKDWMPWSLLAAGTIVVLYTNATSIRHEPKD